MERKISRDELHDAEALEARLRGGQQGAAEAAQTAAPINDPISRLHAQLGLQGQSQTAAPQASRPRQPQRLQGPAPRQVEAPRRAGPPPRRGRPDYRDRDDRDDRYDRRDDRPYAPAGPQIIAIPGPAHAERGYGGRLALAGFAAVVALGAVGWVTVGKSWVDAHSGFKGDKNAAANSALHKSASPSPSESASPSASPDKSPSPSTSKKPLAVAATSLALKNLNCDTAVSVKAGNTMVPLGINYPGNKIAAPATPTAPKTTAKKAAPVSGKKAPVPAKTTAAPKPTAHASSTTPAPYSISENAFSVGSAGSFDIKLCDNPAAEAVTFDKTLSASSGTNVVDVDLSAFKPVIDSYVSSSVSTLSKAAKKAMIAAFKKANHPITAHDVANIQAYAKAQAPALQSYGSNEVIDSMDTGMDTSTGLTYSAEYLAIVKSMIQKAIYAQGLAQTPSVQQGFIKFVWKNSLQPVTSSVATTYPMTPSTSFNYDKTNAIPGQLTISGKDS